MKYLLFLLLISLSGCSSYYARATYEFLKIDAQIPVYYEEGQEGLANQVANLIPESLRRVEDNLFTEFSQSEEIIIYVFSDPSRYAKFSGASSKTRGSATKHEVYISPIILERIETLKPILIHELAHVHLRQYIGTWRYWTEVPGWFHEGLAVEVSNGGGAEKITYDEAYESISNGKYFTPREKSGLLGHKFAHDYGMAPQLYYRQANLFVRFLITNNPSAFKNVYLKLLNGAKFDTVWQSYYGKSIPELWLEFIGGVKA